MSRKPDEYNGAVRIFEALSSVDEELLERSGTSRKVFSYWKYAKVMAACACFVLVGFVAWYGGRIFVPKGGYDSSKMESQVQTAEDRGYYEEAAVEDAVVEEAENEPAEYDADMPETVITENDSNAQEEAYLIDSAPIAPAEKVLGEAEIRAVEELGEYLPEKIPEGYTFENGSETQAGSIYARWSKGMDDIVITVTWHKRDMESAKRIVDISKPESYDVHLYEIPYAETVPEEYRQVFDNPIFLEKDFTAEMVSARIKSMADSGDTGTPRGRFSVLYESGVLVSFNGDCNPEAVWQMFTSIGK